MKQELDIHNYAKKLERTYRLVKKSNISEKNKELIFDFADFCKVNNVGKPRIERYMGILKQWALILNLDFDKATKKDIMKGIAYLQDCEKFTMWTKSTYKIMLKRFFKWINNDESYPKSVNWINTGVKKTEIKSPSPDELITEEEIKQVINSAEHPRDKALISLLYESGCRIGEIGSLQIKNISFDKYGVVIRVMGKTGSRTIRTIFSTPHLSTWMNCHPMKDDKEAPLWISLTRKKEGRFISYDGFRKILKVNFERAGVKKKFNPHFFRHSRASVLANHLTEFQMNQYFGWVQGSDMPSTYVHLNGSQIENSILEMNGMKKIERKQSVSLKPTVCVKCDFINDPDSHFCSKCGGILDTKTACKLNEVAEKRINSDELMSLILKDKNISSMIVQKINEMGLNC